MTIEQLHQQYGKLMIQLEIIQNQVLEVKKQIAEEMNNQNKVVNEKEKV